MTGTFLKEKLQQFDIQLVELSKKLHISPQTLQSRFKTKDVTLNFIIEICNAIKKSPYSLFKGSEYEKLFEIKNYSETEEDLLIFKETEGQEMNIQENLIQALKNQILELKQDKEDLKKDKEILRNLIEVKMGNQEAS